MTDDAAARCAVCGMGGYWVAYSPEVGEVRCVNHIAGVRCDDVHMHMHNTRGNLGMPAGHYHYTDDDEPTPDADNAPICPVCGGPCLDDDNNV